MTNLAPRNGNEAAAMADRTAEGGSSLPERVLDSSALSSWCAAAGSECLRCSCDDSARRAYPSHRQLQARDGLFHKGVKPGRSRRLYSRTSSEQRPDQPCELAHQSNDVVFGHEGQIGVVPLSFYHIHWGHDLLFGATWLNGYDFADFNAKPKPVHPSLGANYEHAMADIKRAIHAHAHDKDDTLENFLKRDLSIMERRYKRFAS
jgi:hypothetical protein